MLTAFILCLLLFLPGKVTGNKQYAFQQISTQDGLSSSVRCLVVSHDKGYVWLSTRAMEGSPTQYNGKHSYHLLKNLTIKFNFYIDLHYHYIICYAFIY